MMSQFAQLTGNEADVAEYQALAAKMKDSTIEKFFDMKAARLCANWHHRAVKDSLRC